jgi:hypothetical protein
MIYPTFQPDWSISATSSLAAEIVFGAAGLASIGYCVNVARREHKVWPLWVIVGSMLTMLWEPFTDMLLDCGYPRGPRFMIHNWFGHDVPLYIFFVYIFYFALPVTWLYQRLEAGATQRQLWKYTGVLVLAAALFEPLPVALGWWRYWGNQPLNFTGLPLNWWFTNGTCVMASAVALYLVRRHLLSSDRQTWVFAPLMLLALWASKCPDIPMVWMMSNTQSTLLRTLGSLGTMVLSLGLLWGMIRAVAVDWHPASERQRYPTASEQPVGHGQM